MTELESADIFFMALTGMTTDELARKIVIDYNNELKKLGEKSNTDVHNEEL